MKKRICIATLLAAMLLLLCAGSALADGIWKCSECNEYVEASSYAPRDSYEHNCYCENGHWLATEMHTFEGGTCLTEGTCLCGEVGYGEHDWSFSADWAVDYTSCIITATCLNDSTHTDTATTDDIEFSFDEQALTQRCEKGLDAQYIAHFSLDGQSRTVSTDVSIPAGHTWSTNTTYDWAKDLSTCTATHACQYCDATETAQGVVSSSSSTAAGVITTTYTATFDVLWAETRTKTVSTCAGEHSWNVSYQWTDDNSACTATWECPVCLNKETLNGTVTSATTATCTENGTTTYTATFPDSDWAETQTKAVETKALGHSWGISCKYEDDLSYCTVTGVCSRDSTHVVTRICSVVIQMYYEPTCDTYGYGAIMADWDPYGGTTATSTTWHFPPRHTWESTTYAWTDDNSACTATHACAKCDATETLEGTVTSATTATCMESGTTTYTATFPDSDWAETQTRTVDAEATGQHNYKAVTTSPTCTEDGYTTYTCQGCGDSYMRKTEKLLHWFGEWSPVGEHIHDALCLREGCGYTGEALCELFEYHIIKTDDEGHVLDTAFTFCPVCGEVIDDTRLTFVENARVYGETWFSGDLVLRMGALNGGDVIMSIGFERDGCLTQPVDTVTFTLPAELLEGYTPVLLREDDTEAALEYTEADGFITFAFDYTPAEGEEATPLRVLRLIPKA